MFFARKLHTSEKSRINPTKSGRPLSTIFVAEFETCSYGLVRVRKKVAHDRSWVLKLCNCGWFGLGFLVAPVSSFQTRAGKLGINRSCNNFVHPEASIVNQSWENCTGTLPTILRVRGSELCAPYPASRTRNVERSVPVKSCQLSWD